MRRMMLPGMVAVAFASGCAGQASYGYSGTVNATVTTPDLVEVSPGVQVIADYDEPIFYSDGFYWRFYDNVWYRSSYYTGGWAYIDAPPITIARIDRPYVYSHYRPSGYVARNRPVPIHRVERPPAVRHDERRVIREPVRAPGYVAPQPVERRPATPVKERGKRDKEREKHQRT